MYYVYLLKSISFPKQTYIGLTGDLRARLAKHNEGGCAHTLKYRPWQLHVYVAFHDRDIAAVFERYLKSGSGRAFASRHFW